MPALDLDKAFVDTLPPPTWIIENVIPSSTIVLVAGDAGIGKSVLNLCEGLHVALGQPFLGFKTRQNRVLYFDQENGESDLTAYIHRLWLGMGKPNTQTLKEFFRVESMSLGRPDWAEHMARIAREWQPGLIYVDTATSALDIRDENDNAEAHRAINKLKALCDLASHPAIRVLKHAKYVSQGGDHKGGTRRTIRGAKAWLGAVDQVVYHIRDGAGRPRKDGLHDTILVPDKFRAFGLSLHIKIEPELLDPSSKALKLKGEIFHPTKDYMIVVE